MATYNIEIRAEAGQAVSGMKKVRRGLSDIDKTATGLGRTLNRVLTFTAVGVATRQLLRMADTYTRLQNRIKVVTQSEADLIQVTDKLFEVSRKTRTGFEATAVIFSRLSLATEHMGVSQEEALKATETLNKALIVSGASSNEARYGLIQLSQALAAGALRGDELRSVLEQMPIVAGAIADELKVTRGELRRLGAEGKISTEIILNALRNASDEINEKFGKTVVTLSQAFQVLSDSFTQVIGKFDRSLGSSRAFAKFLLEVADAAEILTRAVAGLAIAIGVKLASRAIPALITKLKALAVMMNANPLMAIVTVITLAVSALITFGDQILLVEGRLATLHDLVAVVWEGFADTVRELVIVFYDSFDRILGGMEDASHKSASIWKDGFFMGVARMIDNLIGLFDGMVKAVKILITTLANAMVNIFVRAFNAVLSTVEGAINSLIDMVNWLTDAVGVGLDITATRFERMQEGVEAGFSTLGERVSSGFLKSFNLRLAEKALTKLYDLAEDRAKVRVQREKELEKERQKIENARRKRESFKKGREGFLKAIAALQREYELLRLGNDEREIQARLLKIIDGIEGGLTKKQKGYLDFLVRRNEAQKKQTEILDNLLAPMREYKNTLEALMALEKEGKITPRQAGEILGGTQMAQQLQELQEQLRPSDPLAQEMDLYNRRIDALKEFYNLRMITEAEYFELSTLAWADYQKEVARLEEERIQKQVELTTQTLRMGQDFFGSLTDLVRTFADEQSGIYRAMFAATKAFAIGEASVLAGLAISKAIASAPWPANAAAIAEAVAATSAVISQIASAVPRFQTGGEFRVGGSGSADSQMVMFRASPNETVSVRTPSQQRTAERDDRAPAEKNEINIANIVSPDMIEDYFRDARGQKAFLNIIRHNSGAVRGILGGRRS